jgi:hypothetical protein
MSRGTGGIGNAIRSVESARMIGELRDKLDKQQSKNVSGIGRHEITDILKDIRNVLDHEMKDRSYTYSITIHRQHPAVTILDHHIEALQDLDSGKVHNSLRPASIERGAALTAEQNRQDIQLINDVIVVQTWKGFARRREAEEYVAAGCRKTGKRRKGEEITAKMLKSLRDHLKR